MNYIKINEIKNIRGFLLKHDLIYLNKNISKEIICKKLSNFNTQWTQSFDTEQIYLSTYKDNLFVGDGSKSVLLNGSNGNYILSTDGLGYNFRLYSSYTDLIVVQREISILESHFGVYNLDERKLLFLKNDSYPYTIIKDFILGKGKSYISSYNLSGEVEWVFSLNDIANWYNSVDGKNENGEIWNFIDVINGVLWIDVVAKTIIGIDVINGKILHILNKGIIERGDGNRIPFYGKTKYEKTTNKLIGFYNFQYWEVDLNITNPILRIWNLDDLLRRYSATLPNFDVSGINETHIFFGVGSIGHIPQVLVFNRQNFEIEWQYRFENNAAYFSPTKVDVFENQLFVLDNQHTLYIFEKE